MSTSSEVKISETPEYGTMLRCPDPELADQFEDFLTESCFVLFKTKLDSQEVTFFFGQASSVQKVRDLYERFTGENTKVRSS